MSDEKQDQTQSEVFTTEQLRKIVLDPKTSKKTKALALASLEVRKKTELERTRQEVKQFYDWKQFEGIILPNGYDLANVMRIGIFHFEAGSNQFDVWSTRMVGDLGEGIKPSLNMVWYKSRDEYLRLSVTIEARMKEIAEEKAKMESQNPKQPDCSKMGVKPMQPLLFDIPINPRKSALYDTDPPVSEIEPESTENTYEEEESRIDEVALKAALNSGHPSTVNLHWIVKNREMIFKSYSDEDIRLAEIEFYNQFYGDEDKKDTDRWNIAEQIKHIPQKAKIAFLEIEAEKGNPRAKKAQDKMIMDDFSGFLDSMPEDLGANNKIINAEELKEATSCLLKKYCKAPFIPDEQDWKDLLYIGLFFYEGGVLDFQKWGEWVTNILSDNIKPFLDELWQRTEKEYRRQYVLPDPEEDRIADDIEHASEEIKTDSDFISDDKDWNHMSEEFSLLNALIQEGKVELRLKKSVSDPLSVWLYWISETKKNKFLWKVLFRFYWLLSSEWFWFPFSIALAIITSWLFLFCLLMPLLITAFFRPIGQGFIIFDAQNDESLLDDLWENHFIGILSKEKRKSTNTPIFVIDPYNLDWREGVANIAKDKNHLEEN